MNLSSSNTPDFLKKGVYTQEETNYGTSNWTRRDLPNFKGRKAFVLDGAMKGAVVVLLAEAGFQRADSVEDADVVVFTGGSDVNPRLYGENGIANSYYDDARDRREKEIYHQCRGLNKFMFGICRGAQFLWVMNGGKLVQHMSNHAGADHFIVDITSDQRVMASSLHHQAILAPDDIDNYKHGHFEIIAVTEDVLADHIIITPEQGVLAQDDFPDGFIEVEAGYCRSSGCFLIQGHPEIGTREFKAWSLWSLMDHLLEWQLAKSNSPVVKIKTET